MSILGTGQSVLVASVTPKALRHEKNNGFPDRDLRILGALLGRLNFLFKKQKRSKHHRRAAIHYAA